MRLIDIGVNLTNRQFVADLDAVIGRARSAGVERMIITGTRLDNSEQAASLAATVPGLWSTAGVHPHDASECTSDTLQAIEALCAHESVVALGECGLDFNRNYSPRDVQLRVFEQQLEIAARTGIPAILHQRDAHDEFLAILRNAWPSLAGGAVVHCFTEGPGAAEDYLALGCALGSCFALSRQPFRAPAGLRAILRGCPEEAGSQ